MSTKKIHDVKKILQRAKLVCNKESDQELADFLGVKKQTLGAWKNRNSQKAIEKISEAIHGSELVFVLTGETEKPPLEEEGLLHSVLVGGAYATGYCFQ